MGRRDGTLERGDGAPSLTAAYETARAWAAGLARPLARPSAASSVQAREVAVVLAAMALRSAREDKG